MKLFVASPHLTSLRVCSFESELPFCSRIFPVFSLFFVAVMELTDESTGSSSFSHQFSSFASVATILGCREFGV